MKLYWHSKIPATIPCNGKEIGQFISIRSASQEPDTVYSVTCFADLTRSMLKEKEWDISFERISPHPTTASP